MVFAFDHDVFFRSYAAAFGTVNQPAASGLDALLGFLEEDPDILDLRWAAYDRLPSIGTFVFDRGKHAKSSVVE